MSVQWRGEKISLRYAFDMFTRNWSGASPAMAAQTSCANAFGSFQPGEFFASASGITTCSPGCLQNEFRPRSSSTLAHLLGRREAFVFRV